jgi:hypothetical protein
MEKTQKKNKVLICGIILAVVVAVSAVCFFKLSAKGTFNEKSIVVEIIDSEGKMTSYDVKTQEEFLLDALNDFDKQDDSFSFEYQESVYGVMIEKMNGEEATYTGNGAYWALYVNKEYGSLDVNEQPVQNDDIFTFKFEKVEY